MQPRSVHCTLHLSGRASATCSDEHGQMGPAPSLGALFFHKAVHRYALSWTWLTGQCKHWPHLKALPWGHMATMLGLVQCKQYLCVAGGAEQA